MPRQHSELGEIMWAIMIIIAIFGILYMMADPLIGVTLILVCGGIIFLTSFVDKFLIRR
jgi:hypothetical protein